MKHFILLVLLVGPQALLANNQVVPNHYRGHRQINQGAALIWSDRREANLIYESNQSDSRRGGQLTNRLSNDGLSGNIFSRLNPQWNLEAEINLLQGETEQYPTFYYSKTENKNGQIGVGYASLVQPWGVSVHYAQLKAESKEEGAMARYTVETKVPTVALGWRFSDGVYAGVSALYRESKPLNLKADVNQVFSLGLGKVWGEAKNPRSTTESILSYNNGGGVQVYNLVGRGLYNWSEVLQLVSSINYSFATGSSDGHSIKLMLGGDFQVGMFFAGPYVTYFYEDSTRSLGNGGTHKTLASGTDLFLQLGLRQGAYELYFEAGTGDKTDRGIDPSSRDLTQQWRVAGRFSF